MLPVVPAKRFVPEAVSEVTINAANPLFPAVQFVPLFTDGIERSRPANHFL